jgi:hypothetical protein
MSLAEMTKWHNTPTIGFFNLGLNRVGLKSVQLRGISGRPDCPRVHASMEKVNNVQQWTDSDTLTAVCQFYCLVFNNQTDTLNDNCVRYPTQSWCVCSVR